MAYTSVHKGVVFIEGNEPDARIIGKVEYKKDGLYNQQLKNLDCVKEQLADKTISMGGNAVMAFEYGQKSTNWLRSMCLRLDDNINWYGSGIAIALSQERLAELLSAQK